MKGASQIAPFGLRMPEDLKTAIAERATKNGRSMNAEILQILSDALENDLTENESTEDPWQDLSAYVDYVEREHAAEDSSRKILEAMEKIIAKHLARPGEVKSQKPLETLKVNRPRKKFNREK
ncbi:Arc family DNA-binding protein [Raoultella terrigena]|uniref:Arc family DNA-binding protein n=1 Tax=Raoultella terrigena TaxID=577 RepID=UPI003851250A